MLKSTLTTILLGLASLSCVQAAEQTTSTSQSNTTRLPGITATGFSSVLKEETLVGPTQRPEWTNARRFGNTRVYLQQDPWTVGVESWWRIKNHRDGSLSHRLLEEVEIGLPYRLQLDLYNDIEGDSYGRFHYQSFNIEVRWALADWGKIWGNPTLYAEYKIADHTWAPDVYELKLLLGDQIIPRLHYGINFVWEAEIGGEREQEFQVTGGLSYSLIDGRLGVGVEFLYDRDSVRYQRGDAVDQFNIGPSVQLRLTPQWHVDLNCLFATNMKSDHQIAFLIVGYNFGRGKASDDQHYTPVSGRQN